MGINVNKFKTIWSILRHTFDFFKQKDEYNDVTEEALEHQRHVDGQRLRKIIRQAPLESMVYVCTDLDEAITILISYINELKQRS
jgi:hypothetical protein